MKRKYILVLAALLLLVSCGKEPSAETKTATGTQSENPLAKTIGGWKDSGEGGLYTLEENEIDLTEKKNDWSLRSEENKGILDELEHVIRFSLDDEALGLTKENFLYLSDYPVIGYSPSAKKIRNSSIAFYILTEKLEQVGYVSVAFEDGKYKSNSILWEKDPYFMTMKNAPSEKFIKLFGANKAWSLDSKNKILGAGGTDRFAELKVGEKCYDALISLGIGTSYEEITASDRLIQIQKGIQ
jgi:hypothetical protein